MAPDEHVDTVDSGSPDTGAGFNLETLAAPGYDGAVLRIACPASRDLAAIGVDALGAALGGLIEDAERRVGADTTTIVLDVVDADIVPLYVDIAVGRLRERHVRTGVIVVCDHCTTHDQDSTLPAALCASVSAANRRGVLWHPLRHRPVAATLGMATEDAQHKAPSVSTPR
jgi:hypothetical protein